MLTVVYATSQPGSISDLERMSETELATVRKNLPSGTRELVDCDEDTVLFLHPSFLKSELFPFTDRTVLHFQDELIPVITLDRSGNVLMQAFANRESLTLTLESGFGTYYSRSRKSLWKKGDTSGHVQNVKEVLASANGKFLVYIVEQSGAACHEGYYSCFFRERKGENLQVLNVPFLGRE
ncbi:phosphoribosyl-AMP cyclohydrolase [Leptospira fletcheri]|uniref:phosphoribosyl-AMP cyclohydrolase n=1 Tax=Leptospira fletcheri TaxID=2484981 RepID=A0A4R9GI41_9LEPT|nr:phosphoribosyl-AMP cyclohydrolase [Leptospira fletcheri]TGK12051.1 phosphoribosyl-AMP cyclohydrolase [Leptospira fletcheri]